MGPQSGDYLVIGKSWNCFYASELDKLLRKRKVNTVIVTGIHTDACALLTANGAIERGYYVIYVADATAALHEDDHMAGLTIVGKCIGEVKSTDQVVKMLK